jgi:hypothetical protein
MSEPRDYIPPSTNTNTNIKEILIRLVPNISTLNKTLVSDNKRIKGHISLLLDLDYIDKTLRQNIERIKNTLFIFQTRGNLDLCTKILDDIDLLSEELKQNIHITSKSAGEYFENVGLTITIPNGKVKQSGGRKRKSKGRKTKKSRKVKTKKSRKSRK